MSAVDVTDRIAPTLEPDAPVVMHQNWHHLLFLHWEIRPEELQRLVPADLTIDTFEGNAYVGLVPFTLTGVRPILTPPLPWISNFHEINVRTYVHNRGRDPGIWFFSSTDQAIPTIAFSAHRNDPRGDMPANAAIRYRAMEGAINQAHPGTLEHFLVERYILYTIDDNHRLHRARVHHQPYPLQRAEVLEMDETLIWAAGIRRADTHPLRHYASEVNVKVYPLETV
jgi:uncharacterized protein YqjF (DUF2071 family)